MNSLIVLAFLFLHATLDSPIWHPIFMPYCMSLERKKSWMHANVILITLKKVIQIEGIKLF